MNTRIRDWAVFCFVWLAVCQISSTVLGQQSVPFESKSAPTALAAPTLTLLTTGTTVSLSWTQIPDATGYTLYYAPSPYAGPHTIGNISMGTKTSMSAALWHGAAFYVAVTAYNSTGSSGYSNIEHFVIETGHSYNVSRYVKGDTSNFQRYPESSAPEPARGECVYDALYDAHVCKAVDANDFPSDEIEDTVRPVYSRWRIDNSNGQYYFLVKDGESPKWSGKGQMVILNAQDDSVFKIATEVNGQEGSEFRWDYSGDHPNTLYYRSECQFRSYDIVTGQTALIHDFSTEFPLCGRIINDVEGDSSADSRYWAWIVQGEYDGEQYPTLAIITYDKETDNILGVLDHAKYLSMGGIDAALPKPNMVDISPLGSKVLCLWGRTDHNDLFDGPHAYDFDFSQPVKVCNDETHSGWAFDKAGKEVYVCQINNTNWSNAPADTIAYTDIQTGKTEVILFHEDLGWDVGGFHFGRFYNPAIKGWVYMTTYSSTESQSWMRNQAIMLEIAPYTEHPLIWRIADTHNTYPGTSGYEREAFSPISGDGTTIWWAADWPGGDQTVDTYKLKLPDQWWTEILSHAQGGGRCQDSGNMF